MKAVGTFIKKGSRIFRSEAYIQWGDTENIIGTVIMLNPGRARLKIERLEENQAIQDEIIIDPTMESLIKLIEELYENNLPIQGRLYIYNLFPLQNTQSDEAIRIFEQLWNENEPLVKSFPKERSALLNQFKNSPWILLGWGCGRSSENLDYIKEEWLKLARQSDAQIIGKKGRTNLDFYHPRPRLQPQQIEYRKDIKMQFKQLLNNRPKQNTDYSKVIRDDSWKRHVKHYPPVEEYRIGRYRFVLYRINEQEYAINYNFRLLCFFESGNEPILALNHENSQTGKSFYGASVADGHINLGMASPSIELMEFRKWALQNVSRFINDIDSNLLYKKINDFNPIVPGKVVTEVVPIDELMKRRLEAVTKLIREFEDRYEYCYIEEYEGKFLEFNVHAIPLANIQAILIEVDNRIELAALEFLKSDFSIEQVATWIHTYSLYLGDYKKATHFIEGCNKIINIIKFKGNVIAIYTKRNLVERIMAEEIPEITEKFKVEFQEIDTTKSKTLQHGLTILVNGEIFKVVPRIDFNRQKDMIISNGNVIKADFIDEYKGGVGFYRNDDTNPIAFIIDHQTTVSIDLYEKDDNSQLCIVEHKYLLDFEVCFHNE